MKKWLKKVFKNAFCSVAPKFYNAGRTLQSKAAGLAFIQEVGIVGDGCQVSHPYYLKNARYITIGDDFRAGPGLRVEAWDFYAGKNYSPQILIGDGVVVNYNLHIGAIHYIEIGDNVLIGSNVLITDHSHGTSDASDLNLSPLVRPLVSKGPVIIRQNVWIGEGVCILAGVCIGENAVIGANAVVTHDVAAGQVVGGIPARPVIVARTE